MKTEYLIENKPSLGQYYCVHVNKCMYILLQYVFVIVAFYILKRKKNIWDYVQSQIGTVTITLQ